MSILKILFDWGQWSNIHSICIKISAIIKTEKDIVKSSSYNLACKKGNFFWYDQMGFLALKKEIKLFWDFLAIIKLKCIVEQKYI